MSNTPYASAVVGALEAIVNSSYAGWVLLGVIGLAVASTIAHHDGSRVRRAEEHHALELLRR